MNVVATLSTIANAAAVPPEADWHDNAVLQSELAALNTRIARYVTRMLDADAKRGEPVSPSDEAALGKALVEFVNGSWSDQNASQPSTRQLPPRRRYLVMVRRIALAVFPACLKPPAFRQESGQINNQEGR